MKTIINDIKAFKLVLSAMAKNDVRHYLNGFVIDGDKLTATDGRKLVSSKCIAESDTGKKQVIINFSDKTVPPKTKSILIGVCNS